MVPRFLPIAHPCVQVNPSCFKMSKCVKRVPLGQKVGDVQQGSSINRMLFHQDSKILFPSVSHRTSIGRYGLTVSTVQRVGYSPFSDHQNFFNSYLLVSSNCQTLGTSRNIWRHLHMTGIGSSNQHLQTSHTLRGQQLGLAMDVAGPWWTKVDASSCYL